MKITFNSRLFPIFRNLLDNSDLVHIPLQTTTNLNLENFPYLIFIIMLIKNKYGNIIQFFNSSECTNKIEGLEDIYYDYISPN